MEKVAAADSSLPRNNMKRKLNHGKKRKKPNKKLKPVAKPKNPSQKMKKLFKKRAKAYNSDDDDEEEEQEKEVVMDEEASEEQEEEDDEDMSIHSSDDEDEDENQRDGITKFAVGCKAFRTTFLNIINKHLPNDPLGPILSSHKKLVAEKLLEEETEHKSKGEARKVKHLAGEKGHIKPGSFLDTKEKLLISIATKGVVKLFNAVNKAQNPQQGLNPSRSKHVKELVKQRKATFLSELKKSTTEASTLNYSKVMKSTNKENDDGPSWAPLRDSYMLTNSKSKDWDKMPDPAAVAVQGRVALDGSSDED